jgi:hypothetical protein
MEAALSRTVGGMTSQVASAGRESGGGIVGGAVLGAKGLATAGAATLNDFLTILGRHARAEAVTALAHESARLIGPLHEAAPLQGVGLIEPAWIGEASRPVNRDDGGRGGFSAFRRTSPQSKSEI